MKFSLLITIIFLFFIPISVYVLYNTLIKDASITKPDNTVSQPSDDGITLPLSTGQDIDVENFLALPEVTPDTYNAGTYFLGNTFTPVLDEGSGSAYVVTFDAETKYFNIIILKKPLSTARMEMETYLKNVLKISEKDMCALNYTVSVPGYVDEAASGADYRFSFCPGSVQL
jgi:hypothetical protein